MKLTIYEIYRHLKEYEPKMIVNSKRESFLTCELLKNARPPFRTDILYLAESAENLYRLAEQPASVLCFFPEWHMYDYPEFIPLKDIWNFIFLEKPFGTIDDMLHFIRVLSHKYYLATQFSEDLLLSIAGKDNIQTLVNLAYQYFDNSIYIFDAGFQLLASAESPNAKSPSLVKISGKYYIDTFDMEEINREHNHDRMKANHAPILIHNKKLGNDRILCMIDHNRDIGHFVIVADNHPIQTFDYDYVSLFRQALMQYFSADSFTKNVRGFHYEYFLNDLLCQKYAAGTGNSTRLKHLDNAFSPRLYCIVVEVARTPVPIHYAKVRQFLEQLFPATVTIVFENQIIAILSGCSSLSLPVDIRQKVMDYCIGNELYCGLSNSFDNILNLYQYYKQALRAIEIGSERTKKAGLFSYEQYHLSHLINIISSREDLNTFCCPQLKLLLDYDGKNRTELAKTLYYYILLGNTNDTATALFVHRNTVLYRIKQIYDLIQSDLKDITLRHYIMTSYELLYPEVIDNSRT